MRTAVSRTLTAAVTALALTATTLTPAHALGKNERNFLKGAVVAGVVGALLHNSNKAQAAPNYQQPLPSYPPYQPPPYQNHQNPRPPQYTANIAGSAFNEFSPRARRAIQQRLASYGYYTGGIDGIWGRGTASAVERYARQINSLGSLQSRDGTVTLLNGLLS